MTVYVVTHEPYHDTSCIYEVHSSVERAKAAHQDVRWVDEGYYVENWERVVAESENTDDLYLIHQREMT